MSRPDSDPFAVVTMDELRREILEDLHRWPDGVTLKELQEWLGDESPRIYRAMRILEDRGLLVFKRHEVRECRVVAAPGWESPPAPPRVRVQQPNLAERDRQILAAIRAREPRKEIAKRFNTTTAAVAGVRYRAALAAEQQQKEA